MPTWRTVCCAHWSLGRLALACTVYFLRACVVYSTVQVSYGKQGCAQVRSGQGWEVHTRRNSLKSMLPLLSESNVLRAGPEHTIRHDTSTSLIEMM